MRLDYVKIQNYRSIKRLNFTFPESNLMALVGPNNAGKSNIIRAINTICGERWVKGNDLEDYDHYLRDKDRDVKIGLQFSNGRRAILDSNEKWVKYKYQNGSKCYSNVKEDFPCTYLSADRQFQYETSFREWTLLGKIRKAFHENTSAEIKDELHQKFEEVVDLFNQVEGFEGFKNDFTTFFDEMQADTATQIGIDFQPFTPSNYFKTLQIIASDPSQDVQALDLDELGEGSRNMILLSLLRSYARNFRQPEDGVSGILALEEPEIYLHPQARRHLLAVLQEIADSGIQVILSTHSSSFIDTERFHSVGRVYKISDEEHGSAQHTQLSFAPVSEFVEHCQDTGVPENKITEDNVTEFYRTTSNYRLNEGFFARYLILVEGDTEELALPEYLATLGINCDKLGISVIPVGGKNQIPKYWRLFSMFEIPMMVIFDNDDDEDGSKRKSNDNISRCFNIPLDEITDDEIRVYKDLTPESAFDSPILTLEQDFEYALRADFKDRFGDDDLIEQAERRAKEIIKPVGNQNKGQVARFVARTVNDEYPEYAPEFVKYIKEVVSESLL